VWRQKCRYEDLSAQLCTHRYLTACEPCARAGTPKPLIYERVKHRFLDFAANITHHAMDDTTWRQQFSWERELTSGSQEDVWGNELLHHQIIYEELPKQFAHWSDSDLVVYADMDELPDEDLLLHLKHCELKPDVALPINSNAGGQQHAGWPA
jgi:hypothetical protein